MSKYVASTIYERKMFNEEGDTGSVYDDLQDIIAEGNLSAFEDYFGDEDPFLYL